MQRIPSALRNCLLEWGSLTKYLEYYSQGKIKFLPHSQSWRKPYYKEEIILVLRCGTYTLIREVLLKYSYQN